MLVCGAVWLACIHKQKSAKCQDAGMFLCAASLLFFPSPRTGIAVETVAKTESGVLAIFLPGLQGEYITNAAISA